MVNAMPRRTLYDPLQPIAMRTWLVVRDARRLPVAAREIAPGAVLRATLKAARTERITAGWICTDIGRADSVFFAERGGMRLEVGIERYSPSGLGPPSHSDAGR